MKTACECLELQSQGRTLQATHTWRTCQASGAGLAGVRGTGNEIS